MAKSKTVFYCTDCGNEYAKWYGVCPACGSWNTLVEHKMTETTKSKKSSVSSGMSFDRDVEKPQSINDISIEDGHRFSLDQPEIDLLLGGGLVLGSTVLIGGEPGIGKSTFLTQLAHTFADKYGKVLYATGEESLKQVKLRGERLGALSDKFWLVAENNLNNLIQTIDRSEPKLLIVDSIQTLFDDEVSSIPGSVTQIRNCTAKLLDIARSKQVTILIAGHVTKEGVLAGPRLLEHMVDVVLYFEGERHNSFRLLRSVKNRFGSTNEIAVLEMTGTGLIPFSNPSAVFLAQRLTDVSGNAVSSVIQGSRPVLLEIQALVSKTSFGNPRRLAQGVEHNRLLLIIAVLEKIIGLPLYNYDIFINIAGGIKIDDPASDLAIAIAIVSGLKDMAVKNNTLCLGEIGLSGEIRGVADLDKRIREGLKFGFKKFIVPSFFYKEDTMKDIVTGEDIEIIKVKSLRQALSNTIRS